MRNLLHILWLLETVTALLDSAYSRDCSSIISVPFIYKVIFVPGKKYFAGNYGFTLKKIESVVVVVVVVGVVGVVVVKSSERFKALPIELES